MILGIVFLITVISCAKPEDNLTEDYLMPSDFRARATMGGSTNFGLQGYIDTASLNKMISQEFYHSKDYLFNVYEKKTNVITVVSIPKYINYGINYGGDSTLDSLTRLAIFNRIKQYNGTNYIFLKGEIIKCCPFIYINFFEADYGNRGNVLGIINKEEIIFTNK